MLRLAELVPLRRRIPPRIAAQRLQAPVRPATSRKKRLEFRRAVTMTPGSGQEEDLSDHK